MSDRSFRVIPSDLAPVNPRFLNRIRNVVLSRKAQLWFRYHNIDLDFIAEMERRKNDYLAAKTTENIAKITALEIEHALRRGEALPDKKPQKRR